METCPNCGADVPPGAKACPECGSDEKTGWSEQAKYDHLDLPDENFDYDEFVKREFEGKFPKPAGRSWLWIVWVVLLTGIIVLMLVRR